MKRTGISIVVTLTALFVPAQLSFASPTTFKNEGLNTEISVVLDVTGKAAKGTFTSHAYDADEEAGAGVPFTGKVVPTPKGKTGIYLEIQFAGTPPYNVPPKARTLIWFLKIVKHRSHLFIPMQERSYEGDIPRWVVSDVELEPADGD
jgi:hypothetical protein